MNLFGISLLENKSPLAWREALLFIHSLLIRMQHVKSVVEKFVLATKFLECRWKIKHLVNFIRKTLIPHVKTKQKKIDQPPSSHVKIFLLSRKVGKAHRVRSFFVCTIDEMLSLSLFQLETGAQPKFVLTTFFRSERVTSI